VLKYVENLLNPLYNFKGSDILAEIKTNAMRILDSSSIKYEMHTYDCSDGIDGLAVAKKMNMSPDRVYKTLVTKGKSEYFVFVIPVSDELDLKKAAKSVGEKSVEMIHVKDINNVTGYIRGGCSPVGMKKQFKTVIHENAVLLDTFFVSGGKIGFQIEINPEALAEFINAEFSDIIK